MRNGKVKQLDSRLFVFVLCLAIPFVLYFNRHLDDNRLTVYYDNLAIYAPVETEE